MIYLAAFLYVCGMVPGAFLFKAVGAMKGDDISDSEIRAAAILWPIATPFLLIAMKVDSGFGEWK